MVRGRRVRAVMTCTKNNDCCSPNPKRRDAGNISGKLSHTMLTPKRNQSIAQYFQVNDQQFDNLEKKKLMHNDIFENDTNEDAHDLDDKEKEEFKEIIATPNEKLCNLETIADSMFSPPTPHRIELCNDTEEEKVIECDKAPSIPKKPVSVAKPKRRLNNNQASNQQPAANKLKDKSANNHKLTEYFPVRRSVRKASKIVLEEKQRTLEDILRKGIETGLTVRTFEGKGRGVVADTTFARGDFVIEYAGDLIDPVEANRREIKYAQDQNTGCYMYYFKHKGQQYCIDATYESGRLGRLVNHSRNGNLITRTIDVDGKPRLMLIAKDTIEMGEEVTYDYGDRSKESLMYHPWLAY